MEKPFPAYAGDQSYMFVCYAHRDSKIVYPDLIVLRDAGVNLWYDEGISAGKSWRAEIATAIAGTSKLIFFISEASLNSAHCLREVDYALNHDIEIIPVYIEDISLPGELELGLNRVQALFRKTDSRYMEHLIGAIRDESNTGSPRHTRKPAHFLLRPPVLAVGIAVLALLAWTQRDVFLGNSPHATSISLPSAFSEYLEGLELLERWDKDENLDQAIELFRTAVTIDPEFALAYGRLADALRIRYALTGDQQWLDDATVQIDKATSLDAGLAPVQIALGNIHAIEGNMDLASAAFERALSIDPNDPSANTAIATMYARQGRLDDAEASYKKALALEPNGLRTLGSFANFLADQGRFDEAIVHWKSAIRIAPDDYSTFVNLGSVLTDTGKLSEAITMYRRAIEIRPSYMAYSNLGTAYSRAENYEAAVDAYRSAIEIDDTDWLAWGNLAYAYLWMDRNDPRVSENFAKAIALAEAARENSPRDAFLYSDLALYYANTQQPELARQRVETAVALSPDSADILMAAGETYEVMGERDKAIELAQASLEFGITAQRLRRNPALSDLMMDPRMQELQK
ncbi:MAG: tetratricopeptide repeat protein [Woeseiaceae bacterium]